MGDMMMMMMMMMMDRGDAVYRVSLTLLEVAL